MQGRVGFGWMAFERAASQACVGDTNEEAKPLG